MCRGQVLKVRACRQKDDPDALILSYTFISGFAHASGICMTSLSNLHILHGNCHRTALAISGKHVVWILLDTFHGNNLNSSEPVFTLQSGLRHLLLPTVLAPLEQVWSLRHDMTSAKQLGTQVRGLPGEGV